MGFQEQCCKENTWATMCTWGYHAVTMTEDTSNPLGVLPGTHLRYGAPWIMISLQPTLTEEIQGKWVKKGLGNSDDLPAVYEPRHPAVFTIVPSNPNPPVPTLWVPCYLVFSRNTHRYSEVTLLTDVPLLYCFSQFINTAGRTLNKQTEAKSFPGRASLYRLCLSLCKRPSMMTLLLTWSKIFCVKKGRHNGISPVQMWFSHSSLLSFIDKWHQKAEAKHPSSAEWLRKTPTA